MSNDNEDLRAEVHELRVAVDRLTAQVEMIGNIFRMLDHTIAEFIPPMHRQLIDLLRTIHAGEGDPPTGPARMFLGDVFRLET